MSQPPLNAAPAVAARFSVAVAGLGAIGLEVARALDHDPGDLDLAAVSVRDRDAAVEKLKGFNRPPPLVSAEALADYDIVVEATGLSGFDAVAGPAIARGRTLVVSTVAALLDRPHLIDQARLTGARIVVPTGAILGLDAVRAVALGGVASVTLVTRKHPRALAGAPYLAQRGVDPQAITEPTLLFEGSALEAARGFPANANVAAALALAGVGPERTRVQIWADPQATRNTHTIEVEAEAARLTMVVETTPSAANPRTGRLAPLSVVACLRGLTATLKVGS